MSKLRKAITAAGADASAKKPPQQGSRRRRVAISEEQWNMAKADLESEPAADVDKAVWSAAEVNDLPDSAFLYIEAGGEKDETGKTTPRSLRHFPVRGKDGKIDEAHARNAIGRIPQSTAPGLSDEKKTSLQNEARRLLEEATKVVDLPLVKAFGDGVFASVLPPEDLSKTLALPGGEPAEGLHVTLAYFGKKADMMEEDILKIRMAVAAVAKSFEVFPAKVSGYGRFNADTTGEGQDAVYASVDAPALPAFREAVIKACAEAGVSARQDHGFTPHITLARVEKDAPCPVSLMPTKEFKVDAVYVAAGDEWSEHSLSEPAAVEKRFISIAKSVEEQRLVYGVALVPETIDLQGDIISEDEIRKTAHDFLSRYNASAGLDVMHAEDGYDLRLAESYIAPVDFTLGTEPVKKGSWVVAEKVLDDGVWARVKSGELRGFSILGVTKSPEKLTEDEPTK